MGMFKFIVWATLPSLRRFKLIGQELATGNETRLLSPICLTNKQAAATTA